MFSCYVGEDFIICCFENSDRNFLRDWVCVFSDVFLLTVWLSEDLNQVVQTRIRVLILKIFMVLLAEVKIFHFISGSKKFIEVFLWEVCEKLFSYVILFPFHLAFFGRFLIHIEIIYSIINGNTFTKCI